MRNTINFEVGATYTIKNTIPAHFVGDMENFKGKEVTVKRVLNEWVLVNETQYAFKYTDFVSPPREYDEPDWNNKKSLPSDDEQIEYYTQVLLDMFYDNDVDDATDYGVRKNVRTWYQNKRHLFNLYRKHPDWDEKGKCITNIADEARSIDTDVMHECLRKMDFTSEITNVLVNFAKKSINRPLIVTEELLVNISEVDAWSTSSQESLFAEQKAFADIRVGVKLSRAVNKVAISCGLDANPDYNKNYAAFADAIATNTLKNRAVLSFNILDFVQMSNGVSWTSCHSFNGCYRVGALSYANDSASGLYYTVDKDEVAPYWDAPRIHREVFYFYHNRPEFFQSRLYPDDSNRQLQETYRTWVQSVQSNVHGVLNLWKAPERHVSGYITEPNNAHHYRDYANGFYFVRSVPLNTENDSSQLYVGNEAYTLDNGDVITDTDDYFISDERYTCNECGELIDEDDVIYINDEAYCSDCVYYCGNCNSYHLESDFNSDYDLCLSCFSDLYDECPDCGSYYYREDMEYDERTDEYLCSDCYCERPPADEDEESEEV